jgi:hypothetical protein
VWVKISVSTHPLRNNNRAKFLDFIKNPFAGTQFVVIQQITYLETILRIAKLLATGMRHHRLPPFLGIFDALLPKPAKTALK